MRRLCRVAFAVVMATTLASLGTGAPAGAAVETYDQYSRIFSRSAGQFRSNNVASGQWAWNPATPTESHIAWGDPSPWPPDSHERFIRSGDWLLLDGWADNGTYYTQRVTQELMGDGACQNMVPLVSDGGRQHYVRWTIAAEPYCLKAWGTITEQSSGKTFEFGHTQIWYPPTSCSNRYYQGQTCIAQWESWWDNKGSPGTPLVRRLDRKQQIARGIGMAFTIEMFYPSSWRADLRYHWNWPTP